MTVEEMECRITALENRMDVNEAAIGNGYTDLRQRIDGQNGQINRIENIVDAAITTAAHELIDYLRHDDIQNLNEQEFAAAVKRLIFDADDVILPF